MRRLADNPRAAELSTLQLPAPGKINLYLHVVARRTDGMHDLRTRFQFLELTDTLDIAARATPGVARIDAHRFALPREDLIVRAGELLRAHFAAARDCGATITLTKRIPPGSGLGGGSSNAATALLGLNRLWNLGATRAQLAQLGAQLGADVPVFIHARAAEARGVGDDLRFAAAAETWLCLCLPPVEVSTARVFAAARPNPTARAAQGNDLQEITAALYPAVAAAIKTLRQHGAATMSGSGAAVYLPCHSQHHAQQIANQLPPTLRPQITRSVNRHPLAEFPPAVE